MPVPTDPSSTAERLFADWLGERSAGGGDDLEELCREHPEQAERLRALRANWERIHAIVRGGDDQASSRAEQRRAELLARLVGFDDRAARYRVEEEIGRGTMGAVLRVTDANLRRPLAMKVALGADGGTTRAAGGDLSLRHLTRFLEEAEVTGRLDHPGIVPVHELGLDAEGRVYFTMKLVEGQTLREVLDELARGEGGWTQTRVLDLLLKVCDAMAYAHAKGVVHRDLKPSNVMVGRFGEVYVMDWGVAKVLDGEDGRDLRIRDDRPDPGADAADGADDSPLVTMDGDVVGTPAYMSPEQAAGRPSEMGPPSDVYAVGAMLYHLLAGHTPYVRRGATAGSREVWRLVQEGAPRALAQEAPAAPAELVAICERAMARERARRYADMGALAEDLRAYLEHRVVRAHRTGALAELGKWVERNRGLAGAIAAAVLLLVAGLTAALVLQQRTERALTSARALGLASASEEALEKDTLLALLLAREAVAVEETPETLSRLHQAVGAVRERSVLQHDPAFIDAVFSPAGDRLLAISDRVALLSALHGSRFVGEPVRLEGHAAWLTSGCFSGDGDLVLTTAQDRTARLWSLTGEELARFEHAGIVWVAAFSPDGSRVLTGSQDGTAKLWDLGGNELASVEHGGPVRAASFAPDGRILTASADGTARVWAVEEASGTVRHLAELEGHRGPITCAGFAPDGSRIVTASGVEGIWGMTGRPDDTARIWDPEGGLPPVVLRGHANGVEWVVFSPDGERVLTASADQSGRLWDLEGDLLRGIGIPTHSAIWRCCFSPDGRLVAFGCADGTAWLFDASGRRVGPLSGHDGPVVGVRFAPDSRSIATASMDGSVRLWSVQDEAVPTYHGHRGAVYRAAYSPDGARVATASDDRTVRLWDVRDAEPPRVLHGHQHSVYSVEFSPDGAQLLSASRDGTARLWDARTGVELRILRHGPGQPMLSDATFSRDGALIATGSRDGTVRLWDAGPGPGSERPRRAVDGLGMVENVAFAPDGDQLLVGRVMGPVLLVSTIGDEPPVELGVEGAQASFSPSGDRILIASGKSWVLLSRAGDELRRVPAHEGGVHRATFAPDGESLVTTSEDGTARIWSVDGALRATLRGHGGGVFSAVFSRDGRRILTASRDGTARTWLADPRELLGHAERLLIRSFTADELARYAELLGGAE